MNRTAMIGCAVVVGILLLVGVVVAISSVGVYNGLVDRDQAVDAQWGNVENAYQRRADLVPNLVATVRGAADFERGTLNDVVEARARVGQLTASPEMLENPEAFRRFEQAQEALSSALSRLLVVVERYPELQAVTAFRDLMVQLEGSENRIAVERRRYNETARDYNAAIRRVPAAWFVRLLGWDFDSKVYFESRPGADVVPEVDFPAPAGQ
jgi:LemA protein